MEKIYVLDYDEVIRNFKPYHESIGIIREMDLQFSEKIDKLKEEMETLGSRSGLLLGEDMQIKNANRMKQIQMEAIKAESEYRAIRTKRQSDELDKNFSQISDIIQEWSAGNNGVNSPDLIINKNVTVFIKDKFDITRIILDEVKKKNLFQEFVEEEEFEIN